MEARWKLRQVWADETNIRLACVLFRQWWLSTAAQRPVSADSSCWARWWSARFVLGDKGEQRASVNESNPWTSQSPAVICRNFSEARWRQRPRGRGGHGWAWISTFWTHVKWPSWTRTGSVHVCQVPSVWCGEGSIRMEAGSRGRHKPGQFQLLLVVYRRCS